MVILPGILGSWNTLPPGINGWRLDPVLHTYENLIDMLILSGYEEGISLFRFPYDWRRSNTATAQRLSSELKKLSTISGPSYVNRSRFDLVAHSMGGLVARAYIQSDYYRNDVHSLATLGTPHTGAPKAYLIGDGMDVKASGIPLHLMIRYMYFKATGRELAINEELVLFARLNIPTLGQLYPDTMRSPQYLNDALGKAYPFGQPPNPFLETLNSGAGLLTSRIGNSNIMSFVGVRDWADTYDSFQVVRWQPLWPSALWRYGRVPTASTQGEQPPDLETVAHYRVYGPGDETVPVWSADLSLLGVGLSQHITYGAVEEIRHDSLPTDLQFQVFSWLSKTVAPPEFLVNKKRSHINFESVTAFIAFLLCPGDMTVVDPAGLKVGYDPESQQWVNEIVGATYSRWLEPDMPRFVVLPVADGTYHLHVTGKANGDYTVGMAAVSPDGFIQTLSTHTGTISAGATAVHSTSLDSSRIASEQPQLKWLPPLSEASPDGYEYNASATVPAKFALYHKGEFWNEDRITVAAVAGETGEIVVKYEPGNSDASIRVHIDEQYYIVNVHPEHLGVSGPRTDRLAQAALLALERQGISPGPASELPVENTVYQLYVFVGGTEVGSIPLLPVSPPPGPPVMGGRPDWTPGPPGFVLPGDHTVDPGSPAIPPDPPVPPGKGRHK